MSVVERKKWLWFSDIHFPYHDPSFPAWVIQNIVDYKPDVIIAGGDLIDATCASKFKDEYLHSLEQEYEKLDEFLKEIRISSPKSKKVYLHGNHEDHILEPSGARTDRASRSLLHWNIHVKEMPYWEQRDYGWDLKKCCFRIGQVVFNHGMEASIAGIKRQALIMAPDNGLLCTGHGHRPDLAPVQLEWLSVDIPKWRIMSGCGVNLDNPPNYMRRLRLDRWGNGIVVGEADVLRSPRTTVRWDAHAIIRNFGPNSNKLGFQDSNR